MMEAIALADRMTVLCDGKAVLSDTPEKVDESGDEVVRSLFGNGSEPSAVPPLCREELAREKAVQSPLQENLHNFSNCSCIKARRLL